MNIESKIAMTMSAEGDSFEKVNSNLVKIADEYAIEFIEWLGKFGNTRLNNGNWIINLEHKALTSKEVLDRFKKERNL